MKQTLINQHDHMEHDAVLKDWGWIEIPNRGHVLLGAIYDDKKGRFLDGNVVRTSLVEELFSSVALEKGIVHHYARTMNTMYKLG